MKQHINSLLNRWDGNQTGELISLYNEFFENKKFWEVLVDMLPGSVLTQRAVTWIIKHHFDQGEVLNVRLSKKVLLSANILEDNEARLHILQMFSHLDLKLVHFLKLDEFVTKCRSCEHKFVRAWAHFGFFELSNYYPELRSEVIVVCKRALETETASVQASARRVLRKMNEEIRLSAMFKNVESNSQDLIN